MYRFNRARVLLLLMAMATLSINACTLQVAADKRVELLQDALKTKADAGQVEKTFQQFGQAFNQMQESVAKLQPKTPILTAPAPTPAK